jgi:hypothetical protein
MALPNVTEQKSGLKILIVGAGIGGLTAAIALRKQGHHVQIFEQSRFATETGAALHLAPNANGILRRLGLFPEEFGANPTQRVLGLCVFVSRLVADTLYRLPSTPQVASCCIHFPWKKPTNDGSTYVSKKTLMKRIKPSF